MITSSQVLIDAQKELAREIGIFNNELDKSPGFMAAVVTSWVEFKILVVDTARVLNGIQKQQFESIEAIRLEGQHRAIEAEFELARKLKQAADEKSFQALLDIRLVKEKAITDAIALRDATLTATGIRTRTELQASIDKAQEHVEVLQFLGTVGELSFAQVEEGVRKLRLEQEALTAVLDGTASSVAAYEASLERTTGTVFELHQATGDYIPVIDELGNTFLRAKEEADDFGESADRLTVQLDGAANAADRLEVATGGAVGSATARSSSSQSLVDAAIKGGAQPILGGTRIRVAGGGSRLLA